MPEGDPDRMPPPRRGDPVTSSGKRKLVAWIQAGAKLDETAPAEMPTETADEPAPDLKALHEWVSTSGKSMKAYFVRIEGSNLVLRSESGQEKAFPGSAFSKDSIELAKKLAAAAKSQ